MWLVVMSHYVMFTELSVGPMSSTQPNPTTKLLTQPNPTHRKVKILDPKTNPTHNP